MHIPIKNLKPSSGILIAGAGGGFDFLCGLPLASELMRAGHRITLANYSFTNLEALPEPSFDGRMCRVDHKSELRGDPYFPEGYLARWFHEVKGLDMPVHCFGRLGVKSLRECYECLRKVHDLDLVLVIDGGVDGIFRGDEYGLGTPSMDAVSMIAANESGFKQKVYVCTAFGAEGVNQEVAHADVLARLSDLISSRGFQGVSSLLPDDEAAKDLFEAAAYIFERMPEHQHSVIICSMLKALDGAFGYQSVNVKTEFNQIWLSPLTCLYWFCDLDKTARLKPYYDQVKNSDSVTAVSQAIEKYRPISKTVRPSIPI